MGLALPQVVTSDRASGAQVIDGSLTLQRANANYLTRAIGTAGNRRTWTYSCWIKRDAFPAAARQLWGQVATAGASATGAWQLYYAANEALEIHTYSLTHLKTNAVYRDTGWYHVVQTLDTTSGTADNRVRLYINGVEQTSFATRNNPNQNLELGVNTVGNMVIGTADNAKSTYYIDAKMAQIYFIDGQALGPESFGYTDPLTNTWRPKKYTGDFTQSTSQYTGGTALTWDSSPIGSKWTLSNSNKTATGSGSASYTGGNVWSNTINSNTTYAWTLDVTNGDTTGGWYFTDSQSATSTHPDELSGNTLGLRGGDSGAGTYGTFASANGTSDGQDKITGLSSVSPNGTKKIDFVVYRPASGTGKVWVKANLDSTWIGGGNPSDTSSTASFILPDGTTYFAFIGYDTSSTTTLTFAGDGTITSNQGTNSFYLPVDGNSPIGQDKSGQGNDFTPVNFGGSNSLDKATGAKPILNTDGGGNVARPGVFGSEQNVGYAVTVYDDGGGNKYYIDGTKQATLNGLIRGATYTFDTSDSTLGSTHPFRLSATSAHGTEYTDGVVAITGAATTITVPHNAPNSLYYYCTAHSGMGSSITGITTNEKIADPYAWKNVLALPLIDNGAGGTTQDFSNQINAGSTTKASTTTGSTDSTSAQSVFYNRSFVLDGNGDDIRVPDDADFTFGSGDFTLECWAYQTANSSWRSLMMKYDSTESNASWYWALNTGVNNFYFYYSGANSKLMQKTSNTAILLNTWVHFAITRSGNVFRMFENGIQVGTMTESVTNNDGTIRFTVGADGNQNYDFAGYFSDVRVYKGVAKYTSNFIPASTNPDILPDTPSGVSGSSKLTISPDTSTEGAVAFDGNSDYLAVTGPGTLAASSNWCIECTFYCTGTSSGTYRIMSANESAQGSEYFHMRIRNGQYQFYTSNANSLTGTAAFGKWTHIAMTKSGTTVRAYVDGVQLWSTTDNNTDSITNLITGWGYGSEYFPGFISNARFVNGSSVYTSNFTPPVVPLTNITNTAYLFCQSNTSATAYAVSPGSITANGTAAASRFTPFNTDINTVRGQETGYATLNPLFRSGTYSDGNLVQTTTAGNGHYRANIGITTSSGKFYFEYQPTGSNVPGMVGFAEDSHPTGSNLNGTTAYSYYGTTGNKQGSPSAVDAAYGATFTFGDVIGVAFDTDNNTLEYFKNGVSQGVAFTSFPNYPYYPAFSAGSSSNTVTYNVNFGQKPFKFPPPDGFQPLNAANVRPETVIVRPDQYVDVRSGLSAQFTISDLNFETNLMIAKSTSNDEYWIWADSVRGFIGGLRSNDTNAQGSGLAIANVNSNGYQSDSNWFTNGRTYVTYSFKAGGSKNTFNVDDVGYASAAAAGITEGTISLTGASIGTKQGFSILSYSGSGSNGTFGHGLLETPEFVIVKCRNVTQNWAVQHSAYGPTKYTYLNSTNAASTTGAAAFWNNTAPTNSVVHVGTDNDTNASASGRTYIAYCWHNVPGLQKFGSCRGSGTSAAPDFVELGFKPSIVWVKRTDNTGNWTVWDSTRNTFNPSQKQLFPNTNADESDLTADAIDILSNGFAIRSSSSFTQTGSQTYIYCAWAEAPTFNLYGAQSNAR